MVLLFCQSGKAPNTTHREFAMKSQISVVYAPTPLRTLREICEALGVGERMVRRWVSNGAPIAVELVHNRPRYSAELAQLQAWRVAASAEENKVCKDCMPV
jgi:hypothetical protein